MASKCSNYAGPTRAQIFHISGPIFTVGSRYLLPQGHMLRMWPGVLGRKTERDCLGSDRISVHLDVVGGMNRVAAIADLVARNDQTRWPSVCLVRIAFKLFFRARATASFGLLTHSKTHLNDIRCVDSCADATSCHCASVVRGDEIVSPHARSRCSPFLSFASIFAIEFRSPPSSSCSRNVRCVAAAADGP